jgi:molybdenum cofactor biosynthesis enzyme MoaA
VLATFQDHHAKEQDPPLDRLKQAYTQGEIRFPPEESPFSTLFADITHRCNMACRNCYIPVRDLPDLPIDWLYDIIASLPRRTRIRLVGAEPTMREDLPEIITKVRALGHIPVILSNGLKLGRASYVRTLRDAGLGTVYLSLNGGLRDDLYLEIDELACAARKLKALDNLLAARMHVTTGTIIVPGVNDGHLPEFLRFLIDKGVRDMHFRSVGEMGNYMKGKSLKLDALEEVLRASLPPGNTLNLVREEGSSRDFRFGRVAIQLTEWPELGSLARGRIAPDGWLEPMFESIMANEHRY